MTDGFVQWDGERLGALDEEKPFPGVRRVSVTTDRATVARYTFAPGATFPHHRHPEEQVTLVAEGDVSATLGDATARLTAGALFIAPSGVVHGITAGPNGATVVAVVSPPRSSSDGYEVIDDR